MPEVNGTRRVRCQKLRHPRLFIKNKLEVSIFRRLEYCSHAGRDVSFSMRMSMRCRSTHLSTTLSTILSTTLSTTESRTLSTTESTTLSRTLSTPLSKTVSKTVWKLCQLLCQQLCQQLSEWKLCQNSADANESLSTKLSTTKCIDEENNNSCFNKCDRPSNVKSWSFFHPGCQVEYDNKYELFREFNILATQKAENCELDVQRENCSCTWWTEG